MMGEEALRAASRTALTVEELLMNQGFGEEKTSIQSKAREDSTQAVEVQSQEQSFSSSGTQIKGVP